MAPISHLITQTLATLKLAPRNKYGIREEELRMKHYLVFLLCGIPLLFFYAIYNLLIGHLALLILLLTTFTVLLLSWFYLFITSKPEHIYRISIASYAILLCYNFSQEGMVDGRSLWFFTFPLVVFFLRGYREGLIWVTSLPIVVALLYFFPLSFLQNPPQNPEYLFRYITVYVMLCIITFWLEQFRTFYRDDLRTEHQRFQEVLTHSKDILYRRDLQSGKYDYISDAFGFHLGYAREEYSQFDHADLVELLHPDDRQHYENRIEEIISDLGKGEQQKVLEFRMMHKSGRYLWFRDQFSLVVDEDNEPVTLLCSSREVTELRRVEEALHGAKQQLLTILDAIEAHIYVADMETYQILFINKQMEQDFGLDPVGKICWQEFRKADHPCTNCSNSLLLDAQKKSTGVHVWEGYNAVTNRWYMNHDRAIRWVDGRWVRIQIAVDITRQKYLEEEKKYNDEIISRTRQLEAISTLTAGIAHDFNNLLQVIRGNMGIVENTKATREDRQTSLEEIKEATRKAEELVKRMLTLSPSRPKYRLAMPIVPFLEQISIECTEGLSIAREYLIQPDLWTVHIDYNQITTALKNIFINARESIQSTGKIIISAENYSHEEQDEPNQPPSFRQTDGLKIGRYVKVSIEDNGVGISPEQIKKVYEPYFTTKSKSSDKGLGLGLTIAYSIITQHEGTIHIESEPGTGTTVTFYLPASEERIDYRSL